MKEKPTKTFNRHANVIDLLDKTDATLNIDATLNGKFKFSVKSGDKYVARNYKGPNRFVLNDAPYYFNKEVEAHEGARSFKGAKVIKEEI